jgi:hypothetical protein
MFSTSDTALKKLLYILTTFNLILTPLYSQPSITWSRIYVSPMFAYENDGYDICKADGNNFYLIGSHEYPPNAMIIKINEYGDTLWKRYTDSMNASSGVSSGDGGCIFTGAFSPSGYPFTIKFNSTGNLIWFKVYNNANPSSTCLKIIKTRDNGYIICGHAINPAIIVKINSSGDLVWQKEYPASYSKVYRSIVEAYGSGYIAAGQTSDRGIISRIDGGGNIVWEKEYAINNIQIENIRSIDTFNNVYIAGGDMYDTVLDKSCVGFLRLDTSGNILTQQIFSDSTHPLHTAHIKAANNNRIVLNTDIVSAIDSSHARIYIIDSAGNVIKFRQFTESGHLSLYNNLTLENNDFIFVGHYRDTNFHMFTYATRTDSNLYSPPIKVVKISEGVPSQYNLYQNYPNPFNPSTRIIFDIPPSKGARGMMVELVIYDILGREIGVLVNEQLKVGVYEVEWNASNQPSGVYFYRLSAGDYTESKKMILIK